MEGPIAIVDSISPARAQATKHVVHIIFSADLGGRSLEAVTSADAAVRGHRLFGLGELERDRAAPADPALSGPLAARRPDGLSRPVVGPVAPPDARARMLDLVDRRGSARCRSCSATTRRGGRTSRVTRRWATWRRGARPSRGRIRSVTRPIWPRSSAVFDRAMRAERRGVCLVAISGATARAALGAGFSVLKIGEEPWFDLSRWAQPRGDRGKKLRWLLNHAAEAGVEVVHDGGRRRAEGVEPVRRALARVARPAGVELVHAHRSAGAAGPEAPVHRPAKRRRRGRARLRVPAGDGRLVLRGSRARRPTPSTAPRSS